VNGKVLGDHPAQRMANDNGSVGLVIVQYFQCVS
jgi:hypothetical protein